MKRISISSMPVYFLSVFPLKKWAVKRVDKLRRSFLWKVPSKRVRDTVR
jgi:hypothetical protein